MQRQMFLKQWRLLSLKQEGLISKKMMSPREMFPVLSDLLVKQMGLFPSPLTNYAF